jgi:hypothetical protein
MNPRQFRDPEARYRGVSLWMLNDRLEPREMERQVRELKSAGCGAAILRTFIGLRTKYLSPEWNGITRRTIAAAKKLGLKIWLQAGYMPSGVPDLPLELSHQVLIRKKPGDAAQPNESVLLEKDGFVYLARQLPNVLDYLNPAAVAVYMRKSYDEPLAARFGKELGRTVNAVWVDEPHFSPPAQPWCRNLPELFRREWGYSIVAQLPAIFEESGDFQRVRHHYWRLIAGLLARSYMLTVSRWCQTHGVRFAGHLMGEDTLHGQIAFTASTMPQYEHMHVPGIDHLTGRLTWPVQWCPFILTPKQCSSVAHQFGRKEILAEVYGVSTQALTFQDRKRIGDWMTVLGINTRCLHGTFYSMRGRRKRVYVPHLSYQQPWWQDNRIVADYFARLSYALQQGRYLADVLVLHPIESGYSVYDSSQMKNVHDRSRDPEPIRVINRSLAALSENLLKIHRGFDYGDESILARIAKVTPAGLRVGKMTYRAVVLPDLLTLRATTLQLLLDFVRAGGAVFSCGRLPERIDGYRDKAAGRLAGIVRPVRNTPEALAKALRDSIPPEIDVQPAGQSRTESIWLHAQQNDASKTIFLTNISCTQAADVVLRVRGRGTFETWDPATGAVHGLSPQNSGGATSVRLSFAPLASHLIVFRDGRSAPASRIRSSGAQKAFVLPRKFELRRSDPNALALDFCRYRKGNGAWSARLPVIAVQEILNREEYEGPLTAEYRFNCRTVPKQLSLIVEDAADWRIQVNGHQAKPAGARHYIDRSWHVVAVAQLVRDGANVVCLSREFQPVRKPKFGLSSLFETLAGVELEPIFLIGDFAVESKPTQRAPKPSASSITPTPLARELNRWNGPRTIWRRPEFTIVASGKTSCGELVADGYPFFAGRASLLADINLPAPRPNQRAVFSLPALHAALAHIRVNGKHAGTIAWAPYEVDITARMREGENRIEIELVGTLRNLLGPHHRARGEWHDTWQSDFSGCWSPEKRIDRPDWYLWRGRGDSDWTDDYGFVPFGVKGRVTIRFV